MIELKNHQNPLVFASFFFFLKEISMKTMVFPRPVLPTTAKKKPGTQRAIQCDEEA